MNRQRPFILPLLILAVMLCATWLVWDHERQNSRKELRSQFDFLLRETVSRVEQRMAGYEQMLRGVQGLFATTDVMDRDNFRTYIDTLQLDANFSGIQAIGIIEWVPEVRKKAHVAALHRLGHATYAITPAGQRDTYTPIVQLEPNTDSNRALSGLDQWPDPVQRLAMEKARDTGMPAVSGMLRLAVDKETDAQPGFMMYLPIYAKGQQHDSQATRRTHLTGWIFAAFNMHNLIASLYGEQLPGVALAIYDDIEPSPATLLYSSFGGRVPKRSSGISANEYLVVAGHTWMLSMSTNGNFDARFGRNAKTLIVVAGSSLSLILALLAWSLANSRAHAMRLATTMTWELHQQIDEYKVVQKLMLQAEESLGESNRKLETLSITDGLTGIANRRCFDEVLAKEYARHARSGAELSLILLDIDHFKAFNDSYGHVKGDECLRQIAQVIADCATRDPDLAARYGGEEFACILPETDLNGAIAIAEKIRRGIIARAIPHKGSNVAKHVTASLGVATMHCAADKSFLTILSRVDELLYRAKASGRNRVEFVTAGSGVETTAGEGNENLVQLVWKDSYCCGNRLIDSQHQSLFQIANELFEAVLSGSTTTEISSIISSLLEAVSQHFRDEEAILESVAFPGIELHKTEHATLLAKGLDLSHLFEASTLSVGALFQFLAHDVVMVHMLGADREYVSFINKEKRIDTEDVISSS